VQWLTVLRLSGHTGCKPLHLRGDVWRARSNARMAFSSLSPRRYLPLALGAVLEVHFQAQLRILSPTALHPAYLDCLDCCLALWLVCATAASFVSGWRAFSSVSLFVNIDSCCLVLFPAGRPFLLLMSVHINYYSLPVRIYHCSGRSTHTSSHRSSIKPGGRTATTSRPLVWVLGFLVQLRFASRGLTLLRVCGVSPSFVSGLRAPPPSLSVRQYIIAFYEIAAIFFICNCILCSGTLCVCSDMLLCSSFCSLLVRGGFITTVWLAMVSGDACARFKMTTSLHLYAHTSL
jgi:hypothetical protein